MIYGRYFSRNRRDGEHRRDRGEEVKTLQRLLGVTDDGIFGAVTEATVKEWQSAHGLYPDKVVGKSFPFFIDTFRFV